MKLRGIGFQSVYFLALWWSLSCTSDAVAAFKLQVSPGIDWACNHCRCVDQSCCPCDKTTSAITFSELLVLYRNPADQEKQESTVRQVASLLGTDAIINEYDPFSNGLSILVSEQHQKAALESVLFELRQDPDIEAAAINELVHHWGAKVVPNDPHFRAGSQYTLEEATGGANVTGAWQITTGATNVTLAVIDSGKTDHQDLVHRFVQEGYDFINDIQLSLDGDRRDDNPSDPGDGQHHAFECTDSSNNSYFLNLLSSWHGNHVTGIAGASTDNGMGIAGVDWQSKILPIRALGRCGHGRVKDIDQAIRWASGHSVRGVPDNNSTAHVINLSLGTQSPCHYHRKAIALAHDKNITVVVAAGNEGRKNAADYTPANCPHVVTVTSVDDQDQLTDYANVGSVVDLAAPGGTQTRPVLSTVDRGDFNSKGDGYGDNFGTSMAAPHVAGTVTLMLSVNPTLTPEQIKTILRETVRDFPAGSACAKHGPYEGQCGTGILNAGAAVHKAREIWVEQVEAARKRKSEL